MSSLDPTHYGKDSTSTNNYSNWKLNDLKIISVFKLKLFWDSSKGVFFNLKRNKMLDLQHK